MSFEGGGPVEGGDEEYTPTAPAPSWMQRLLGGLVGLGVGGPAPSGAAAAGPRGDVMSPTHASTTPSAANGTNANMPLPPSHFFSESPAPVIAGTPSAGTPARGRANFIQPSPANIQPSPAPSASAVADPSAAPAAAAPALTTTASDDAGNQALVVVERLAKLQFDAAKQEEERREQTARREERVDHALADLAGHVKVLASEVKGLKEGLAETKETTKELEEKLATCESIFEELIEITDARDRRTATALEKEETKRETSHAQLLILIDIMRKEFEELKQDFDLRKKNEEESH